MLPVETVELRVGRAIFSAPKLLVKLEVTPPWNSWKTLAEANGCQTTLPEVTVVPTRTLRRPRVLSMSLTAKIQGGTNFPERRGAPRTAVPGTLSESTCVLDQTIPADGSMNH